MRATNTCADCQSSAKKSSSAQRIKNEQHRHPRRLLPPQAKRSGIYYWGTISLTPSESKNMSKKVDSLGRDIFLCWLCNKRLTYYNEILNFRLVNLPNGTTVKMHKVCAEDFEKNPCSYE